ncbi:MAG: DUF1295 domain-containing protein [Steroidobacteraceae bacterium]
MGTLLTVAACAALGVMAALWAIGRRSRNYGLVDLGWAANFIVLAGVVLWLSEGWLPRLTVFAAMYMAWSLRLTVHLARRIVGHPEDSRYARLRAHWAGRWLDAKFLGFFLAQGGLNLLLVVPLLLAARNPAPRFHWLELAAVAVWLVSIAGETLADSQLARFKRAGNAGKVCDVGLWNWSRHPNYFFESGIWVAYALFALGSPGGWMALFAPVLMIYLLLEVTGVRPTEEQAVLSRGDAYRDYQRRVSRFIPWPRGALAGSNLAMRLLATGRVPDVMIRRGIRKLLAQRLEEEGRGTLAEQQARHMAFVKTLRASPLAIHTQAANEQHYEVPAAFFEQVLGPRLKYSGAWFEHESTTLAEAEEAMLAMTVQRAALRDGDRILELGCGWGSLTLYMAQRFPGSRITAVSNSGSQREFILARAASLGLANVEIITCDANVLDFPEGRQFDRLVSVEMFEHLRNYEQLFARIGRWLRPGGTLFVHIFTHLRHAYPFDVRDSSDFMARHFFTGGIMPSDRLLLQFQGPVLLREHWHVDGTHYQRTAEAWLANMDRRRASIEPVLRETYGAEDAAKWFEYWRVFFMSCAELWGYERGREWIVSHYLFERPAE